MVVVVDEVVDKEVDKALVKVVKAFNDGLVKSSLRCFVVWGSWQGGDQGGRVGQQGVGRGGHKVDSGHRDDVDKEADVEVNREFDRDVDNVFDE